MKINKMQIWLMAFLVTVLLNFQTVGAVEDEFNSLEHLDENQSPAEILKFFEKYRPAIFTVSQEFSGQSDALKKATETLNAKWKKQIQSLAKPEQEFRLKSLVRVLSQVKRSGDNEMFRLLVEAWFLRYGSKLSEADLRVSEKVAKDLVTVPSEKKEVLTLEEALAPLGGNLAAIVAGYGLYIVELTDTTPAVRDVILKDFGFTDVEQFNAVIKEMDGFFIRGEKPRF